MPLSHLVWAYIIWIQNGHHMQAVLTKFTDSEQPCYRVQTKMEFFGTCVFRVCSNKWKLKDAVKIQITELSSTSLLYPCSLAGVISVNSSALGITEDW